jgi:hypothetical protein
MTKRIIYERVMSTSIQSSSMRGLQASLSTARGAGSSRPSKEKTTKQRDDLANAKLIPSILSDYIPPLAKAVSQDSVPRKFYYTMITTYLLKGIWAVRAQQDNITVFNFSDFNLEDCKNYSMLSPYKYLNKMKGKNKDNPSVMDNEPCGVHSIKFHEDPTLRKAPGSEFLCQVITFMLPWQLPMDRPPYYSQLDVDPYDHELEYARTRSIGFLSRKSHGSCTST